MIQRSATLLMLMLSPALCMAGSGQVAAAEAAQTAQANFAIVDFLPFVIAALGITGLLIIRRQSHFL